MFVNNRNFLPRQSGNADAHQDQLIIHLSKSVEARTEDLYSDWKILSQSWQCFVDFQDQEKNFCLAPNGCRSLMVFSAVYGDGREVLVLGHDEQYLDGTEDCYVSYPITNQIRPSILGSKAFQTVPTWRISLFVIDFGHRIQKLHYLLFVEK